MYTVQFVLHTINLVPPPVWSDVGPLVSPLFFLLQSIFPCTVCVGKGEGGREFKISPDSVVKIHQGGSVADFVREIKYTFGYKAG